MGAAALNLAPILAPVAASGLTAGVDWAKDDHAIAVVDHAGRQTRRFSVASTAEGLRELIRRLRADRVVEVAIERPDGVVVDALLAAGLTVTSNRRATPPPIPTTARGSLRMCTDWISLSPPESLDSGVSSRADKVLRRPGALLGQDCSVPAVLRRRATPIPPTTGASKGHHSAGAPEPYRKCLDGNATLSGIAVLTSLRE